MKVVILAGGFGTRISEESQFKPKPMVEIGEQPILWHIMKIFSHYGFNDFVICLGYKGYVIKEYFADYFLHTSDVTFDLCDNKMTVHSNHAEHWRVTLVDTGLNTMTGGRIKRIKDYIGDEAFLMTYGDGVSDINIGELVAFHKAQHERCGTVATLTAVNVPERFGVFEITDCDTITNFREKAEGDARRVNAGFMVLEPQIFDYIKDDSISFEKEPLEAVAAANKLSAYKHDGFWQCMDTQREKNLLEEMWSGGNAPWKIWND